MKKLLSLLYLTYCIVAFSAAMLLALPFILLSTALLPRKSGKNWALFFMKLWSYAFSFLALIHVKRINTVKKQRDTALIYTCNHSSFLDAIAICIAMEDVYSPLGKVEMARVPVFGWIYRRMVILIDRKDPLSRAISVAQLKEELERGISIFIFPEGTMNRSKNILGDFYDGAFKIAIETQTNIQPLVLKNSGKLLPANDLKKIRPGTIEVEFGEIISVKGMTLENLEGLKVDTKKSMLKMLQDNVTD